MSDRRTDAAAADAAADAAFRTPFRVGLLAVAALFLAMGGLIAAFGSTDHPRPEGVAERWLSDVGDTRRDGVRERATDDAEEIGPLALALDAKLQPAEDRSEGRAAFLDLGVGKARREADGTRVPFRLHQRIDGSSGDAINGTLLLHRIDADHWRIAAVEPPVDGIEVPSEGGAPAAEAPIGLFVGAVVVALALAALCSVAVRAAGRAAEVEAAAKG